MNNFLVLLFLGLCGCFVVFDINAQQIVHLSNKNGLLNGTVNAFEKDSLGYIWIGTDHGISRYSGVEFKNYILEKQDQNKSEGIIQIVNVEGDVYIIGSGGSLFKYNYETDRFSSILYLPNIRFLSLTALNKSQLLIGLSTGFIVFDTQQNIHTDMQHTSTINNRQVYFYKDKIYSATSKGLHVYNYSKETKKLNFEKKYLEKKDIITFALDPIDRIWIGTEVGGLYIIEKENVQNIPISQISNRTYAIRKIKFDKNSNALVAVDRLGLFVLDKNFEIIKSFSHNVDDENSISQNSIYEIYVDDINAYWLGVREGGINIINQKDNVFTNISHVKNNANSIHNNNIRSIFESSNGDIWFGTENGVSKYDKNKNWTNYYTDPKLFNTAILAINQYKNNLILGTYGEGLLALDEKTGAITSLNLEPPITLKFIFSVNCFNDNLWIDGNDGPLVHYIDSRFVGKYPVGLVRSVTEGHDQINYIGSSTGLFEINTRNASLRKIHSDIFNAFNEIYNLNVDYLNNCIWIGCKNGLYKYNLSTEIVENPDDIQSKMLGTVFSIKKDNVQNLYLAAMSGLWKYDIKRKVYRKYGIQDGLTINEFGSGASAQFRDGSLSFGGPEGAVIFNPIDLVADDPVTNIYITNFQINSKEPDSLTLPKNINYTKRLILDYDQNTISFNFETIKFHGSRGTTFTWKLEGYDDVFQQNLSNEKVIYSNLKPGNYKLIVKGFNADGIRGQSDYFLEIAIKNPFWKTIWAFILYTLVVLVIVYLFFKISKANIQKRFDENRIMFFIEVAHDIRTPVSLIQLLVKQMSNQENVEKSIELIQRSTENLNEYVTQLLDFQKIDRKELKLTVSKVDLKDCLQRIINDFTPILQEKSLDVILEVKHIPVWFDVSKMNRIFYNLISNAIKYSHEGGEIKIKAFLKDDSLHIEFIDNGIGVPEKQQELIFNRFTRGTNVTNKGIPGTGLGLMLSKKIIELHGGKILLQSQENVGSKFTIVLPVGTKHYSSDVLINTDPKVEEKIILDNFIHKDKLILLVEDNAELREAIKNEISKNFLTIEAANGKEGLILALSKNPDLIITDVMMPEMDGNELCNLIKTNFKTSHIPVIMLTALAELDDKIQGLEKGADAYIEKPFNVDIVIATINNLLKSRGNIHRLLENKAVKKELTPDESFLSDVIEVIKNNVTEQDFSIDRLADIMGLSRSNLFRKLKGLVKMSPSDLIIKIKLNRAEQLMQERKNIRISEIAYESGFQDPKYFSTLFRKHYGKTPTEFMEEIEKK
jgi:signal transduction histidine kinase/DNA-binding response OmpR family regulator/ligand-binding sensor domain-containing protein